MNTVTAKFANKKLTSEAKKKSFKSHYKTVNQQVKVFTSEFPCFVLGYN